MPVDCHVHMVLDGIDWKNAIARHDPVPDVLWIRKTLAQYQQLGFTYLRDGGDRWGVGQAARKLASEYGITFRTPLAPLCKAGHYGSFIGRKFESTREFAALVREQREHGGDFVKIMISGLMDFDHFGRLSESGLPEEEIRTWIHIAHEEGMVVMAHANGAETVKAAAQAGVDSVEHGAYLDAEALEAMAEHGTVWVPTVSTVGNLLGRGRFNENAVRQILENLLENISCFGNMGGYLAPGTDAGAWAVDHGSLSEYRWLEMALGASRDSILERGIGKLREKF